MNGCFKLWLIGDEEKLVRIKYCEKKGKCKKSR